MDLDVRSHAVLVVDDEPDILRTFELSYGDELTILTAASGPDGLAVLQAREVAVIVADQRMPGMSGTEFLERSMTLQPEAVRIILTGYTDIEALVRAVNASHVWRYVAKPWDSEELRLALLRAIEVFHLKRENQRLVEALRQANARLVAENTYLRTVAEPPSEIVGQSPAVRRLLELVARVAPTRSTVLIEGETGTGKELVARAIHAASQRRERLFVAVNCAALSEGILESELFGHRKGAFTGALSDRKGLFEVADGGTIFLDEVSETSGALQAKLLRVLQEGEVRPVGDMRSRRVDVRVIAATNRRLADEVAAGRFRSDLYYRLCVFPIAVPPLRARREDIPLLARHFLRRLSAELGKPVGDLTADALEALMHHAFPGNVRELRNELERAILLAEPGAPIGEELLSDTLQARVEGNGEGSGLQKRTEEFERQQLLAALERHHGVKMRVAEEMGMTYRGLMKKLRRLGL